MSLSNKAVIVSVTISATTLKKTDKSASQELTERKRAVDRSARVVKDLVNPSNLKPIIAVQSAFRAYLERVTVPWVGGMYLLPRAQVFEFSNKVNEFRGDLEREVDRFINRYSSLIDEARNDLGDLFDYRAYPDQYELKDKFSISTSMLPMPDFNKFSELGLEPDMTDQLRQEAVEQENKLMRDATANLYKRVQKRVQMLGNRFKDAETKKYRESLVEGLQSLVDTLPDLNIAGDPGLQIILDDISAMLQSFSFEDAKKSEDVRKDVAEKCDEILGRLNSIF